MHSKQIFIAGYKNNSYSPSPLSPKEFLAIRRAISLNETFVLFC